MVSQVPAKTVLGMPRAGFRTFYWSCVTLFQALTLEGWTFLMYDAMTFRKVTGAFFYISWVFIGNYLLLSLMVSIIMDTFEREYKGELERKTIEKKRATELRKKSKGNIDGKVAPNSDADSLPKKAPGSTLILFKEVEQMLLDINSSVESSHCLVNNQIVEDASDCVGHKAGFTNLDRCVNSPWMYVNSPWMYVNSPWMYVNSPWIYVNSPWMCVNSSWMYVNSPWMYVNSP
jgi:hypothetical protein